jgi:tetratricopeptide (TPR) repeat protein
MSVTLSAKQWYEKGDAALRAGQYERADDAFRRALVIEPQHANALYRLGELALFRRDEEIGEDLFLQALDAQPGHVWATKKLAQISKKKAAVAAPPVSQKAEQPQAAFPTYKATGPGIVGTVSSIRRYGPPTLRLRASKPTRTE